MKLPERRLMKMEDIPGKLDVSRIDVLITIGAGNIDRLVEPVERKLNAERP